MTTDPAPPVDEVPVPETSRHPHRVRDIAIIVLVTLAIGGIAVMDFTEAYGFWYWLAMIPIFGGVGVMLAWRAHQDEPERRPLLLRRQLLHWCAAILGILLTFLMLDAGSIDRSAAGLVALDVADRPELLLGRRPEVTAMERRGSTLYAGGLDGDVAVGAVEQVWVGQHHDGEWVVERCALDPVVACDVVAREELEQVGEHDRELPTDRSDPLDAFGRRLELVGHVEAAHRQGGPAREHDRRRRHLPHLPGPRLGRGAAGRLVLRHG